MGKKSKIGKQRKDRFYHLAKETGFRSRAAFKLIQLNRKFEFLQKSRVAIDLCAAPGGWLQVCSKYMPVSSVIVGVDLVAIKPIPNCITLTHDITTDSCRSALKRELKTWKADLVLNDGAPNVGKSWIHDAFLQNRLTLSAIKLASEFLMKGGTFVTKVFRSKDYNSLIWLLTKLFKKVSATKPSASRNESAEIFIVASGFIAPDKIDAKFFNPNYLFEDVENEEADGRKARINLLKPVSKQKRPKAEGYATDSAIQHTSINVSEFISNPGHLDLLAAANALVFDDDIIRNHPATTNEIVECVKDIKVLGRKELLNLIRWRKKIRKELAYDNVPKTIDGNEGTLEEVEQEEDPEEILRSEEERALRRKRKKVLKERRKLQERMDLKMIHKNDQLVDEGEDEIFSLAKLKSKAALKNFQEFDMSDLSDDEEDQTDDVPKYASYDKNTKEYSLGDLSDNDEENAEDLDEDLDEDVNEDSPKSKKSAKRVKFDTSLPEIEAEDNDLLVDLDSKPTRETKSKIFLSSGLLGEMLGNANGTSNGTHQLGDDSDDEEVLETLTLMETNDSRNTRMQRKNNLLAKSNKSSDKENNGTMYYSSDDTSSDDEDSMSKGRKAKHPKLQSDVKLDPESLAVAETMITSSKAKRDLMDEAWNRHALGGLDDAPSWFRKDEQLFNRRPLPDAVDPSTISKYRARAKELNVRPIKKVAEAKARKKKRALAKMQKLAKKAENISNTEDIDDREKAASLRNLYKKALSRNKKKEVKYVVAKKGTKNQRPTGHKGKYKMVDPRMKKDNLKKKKLEKQQNKGRRGPKSSKPNKFSSKKRTRK